MEDGRGIALPQWTTGRPIRGRWKRESAFYVLAMRIDYVRHSEHCDMEKHLN